MSIEVYLGKAISERRRYLGLNQEQLGAKAGIHRAYLSDVERGTRNITLNVFERIARSLQVPMATLMHEAEERYASETHLASMGEKRRDLSVLVEQLTDQLSELARHAQELKAIGNASKSKLGTANENASQLMENADKQRSISKKNDRERKALEEQKETLNSRETHVKHREKFLDQRTDDNRSSKPVQRKKKRQ